MGKVDRILEYILHQTEQVVEIQSELTATKSIAPENGGHGEFERAKLIEARLQAMNIPFTRFECPDDRVECGFRPNIVAVINGESPRKLWLFGHMDTLPAGDESLWHSDPYKLKRDGDILIGRGVEDNQQAIVSMLVLANALTVNKIVPKMSLGLVFMADEENGSAYGLDWLLSEHPNIFSDNDWYIVPDSGTPGGGSIEVAEKAILHLKFTTHGHQTHSSKPQKGKNAFLIASALILSLTTELSKKFPQENPIFDPPYSTFAPTMHEFGSPAINIIPGKDVFFMDCRINPEVSTDDVLKCIRVICEYVGKQYDAQIDFEVIKMINASQVQADIGVTPCLKKAIENVYNIKPVIIGLGVGTVARSLRNKMLPAVVWCNVLETCHQSNEKSSISATCKDACVFAHILMNCADG